MHAWGTNTHADPLINPETNCNTKKCIFRSRIVWNGIVEAKTVTHHYFCVSFTNADIYWELEVCMLLSSHIIRPISFSPVCIYMSALSIAVWLLPPYQEPCNRSSGHLLCYLDFEGDAAWASISLINGGEQTSTNLSWLVEGWREWLVERRRKKEK